MNDDNNNFDEFYGEYYFNKQNEINDDISFSSSSNVSIFDKNQSQVKKINSKQKQSYSKPSWVWHYFKCDSKFVHNGSTGNMGNHLQNRHNLSKNKN
ncbi:5778_t:CDS:2, partial [Dentiscutata erythropus]